jgi:hypothetical protein
MRLADVLLVCVLVVSATGASAQVLRPSGPAAPQGSLEAKCRAASFARHPAGEMATTMREVQIQRCIKNGFLDEN